MARLALVVLAFGLIICVYAESEEHQKHSYQVNSHYSRSKGPYDYYRNEGRDNKWEDTSSRHGYNKNKEGKHTYDSYQKGKNNPDYRYPGKGDYHGYDKSRGSDCDCDYNKGGFSNYKGYKGGSYNRGYDSRRHNIDGNYRKNSGEEYNRDDYESGQNNNFNHKYKGHGNLDYYGNEKFRGNGYDNGYNKGGYPSYKGPKRGRYYPGYDRDFRGHNSDGNYRKNSGEDYNRDDYESGQNDNFNHKHKGHGNVDYYGNEKSRGNGYDIGYNKGCYPSYKGPKRGRYYPGYDRDFRGHNSDGNYRKHSGEDYNRDDYESGLNNNFNHKYKGHGNVDYYGNKKSRGSGYDIDHTKGGYPSYKLPKGNRYDPGYERDSNSGRNIDDNYKRNSGQDYNRGDYGSSKKNNFNYVEDKGHGNYNRPVYKGGIFDFIYDNNRDHSNVNSSTEESDSKQRRIINTPSHDADHYGNDGRSRSVEHNNDTAIDSRNKQKIEIESTSDVGITNNVHYSDQLTKATTEAVHDDITESTNNKQKTENVRSKNGELIKNYQVNNQDKKVGIPPFELTVML